MHPPVQVTFRDMPISDAVEAACWAEAAELERRFGRIGVCHVVVTGSRPRPAGACPRGIRISLCLEAEELSVDQRSADRPPGEDVEAAVRDAFGRMRRLLEDFVRTAGEDPRERANGERDGA